MTERQAAVGAAWVVGRHLSCCNGQLQLSELVDFTPISIVGLFRECLDTFFLLISPHQIRMLYEGLLTNTLTVRAVIHSRYQSPRARIVAAGFRPASGPW